MKNEDTFTPTSDPTSTHDLAFGKDPQQILYRLSHPVEAYLADVDPTTIQHPEFVKLVIQELPLYLHAIPQYCFSDTFRNLLSAPYIKELIADDAFVINSASQQILTDYLYLPKNNNDIEPYEYDIPTSQIETVAALFLPPNGLKTEEIQNGLELALKFLLSRTKCTFETEIDLLNLLNRHNLDTSIYQSEEIKKMFIEKFNCIVNVNPFLLGYSEKSPFYTIFAATFILGKDISKIRQSLIYALPRLLIHPISSEFFDKSISKLIPYHKAKKIFPFNFTINEYNTAAHLAKKILKQAEKVSDPLFYGPSVTNLLIESMKLNNQKISNINVG